MTLYRIEYKGDIKLNRYTEMLIENGQLVPVEPIKVRIMCDECDGTGTRQGFIGSSGCSVCDERGFIIAPVVVVEDTE